MRGQTLDDAAAIQKCKQGSANAFRFLVERYQAEAMGHAIAITGNRQDAEDAMQEAFLRAYSYLQHFDETRRFYPWFYSILRNCCWKLTGRSEREKTDTLENPELLASNSSSRLEERLALEQALASMSPQNREILTLRHLDDLSYEELSSRLEIPLGTVMSRLFYARKELRKRLEGKR